MDAKIGQGLAAVVLSVSIHAPVMDAKFSPGSGDTAYTVSIHAPVMDAKQLLALTKL